MTWVCSCVQCRRHVDFEGECSGVRASLQLSSSSAAAVGRESGTGFGQAGCLLGRRTARTCALSHHHRRHRTQFAKRPRGRPRTSSLSSKLSVFAP